MKILASENFLQKIKTLNSQTVNETLNTIKRLELSEGDLSAIEVSENIYALNGTDLTIFYTITDKKDSEFTAVLLDIVATQNKTPVVNNIISNGKISPQRETLINPNFNTSINPRFNTSINPKFNTSINPKFNTSINPRFNTSINPKFNTSINPKFNTSINTKFNTSINPKFNTSINPLLNSSYSGPYLFDLNLNTTGYVVIANESIALHFDLRNEFIGTMVKVNNKVDVEFDKDNNWICYYVEASERVRLRYDLENNWNGFIAK